MDIIDYITNKIDPSFKDIFLSYKDIVSKTSTFTYDRNWIDNHVLFYLENKIKYMKDIQEVKKWIYQCEAVMLSRTALLKFRKIFLKIEDDDIICTLGEDFNNLNLTVSETFKYKNTVCSLGSTVNKRNSVEENFKEKELYFIIQGKLTTRVEFSISELCKDPSNILEKINNIFI